MNAFKEYSDMSKKTSLYMRVYEYYKTLILNGKLPPNSRLPSIRRCSAELSVSRTTAETAYLQLAADGYVVSKPQSGYFVTNIALNKNETRSEAPKDCKKDIIYDFGTSSVDSDSFDFNIWRRYIKSALRQDERLLSYGEVSGELELREAICNYIREQRNAICTPENIIIGAGVQSLLHIICKILETKSNIAFADQSFMQGIAIFRDHGFNILSSDCKADILYISPSHINRWGDTMNASKRIELISNARKSGTVLIEDDYDSEFGYFSRKSPCLQGLDGGRNVIYIGTFSKLLLPSIRISFMILPDNMLEKYNQISPLYNQTASKTEQIALCQFIRDGHLSASARKAKKLYTSKMKKLCDAINDVFHNGAKAHLGEGGFVVRLEIFSNLTSEQVVMRAKNAGILVSTAEIDSKYPQILLSCSGISEENYYDALKILKNSL
ncbi:MAG: PLP-dependent aminotransferase family protein [Oscillospiraceae bacterium]